MKMKRFVAPDIRGAIRMVREELGADAVILSNKNVDDGTEIVAAIDFDEDLIRDQINETPQSPEVIETGPQKNSAVNVPQLVARSNTDPVKDSQTKKTKKRVAIKKSQDNKRAENSPVSSNESVISEVRREFQRMQTLLDRRLPEGAYQNSGQSRVRREIFARLGEYGFSTSIRKTVSAKIDPNIDLSEAWHRAKILITECLSVPSDSLMENGGVIALVGPTGVGKTTTIAKLAAKYRLKHGSKKILLVTTDNYRIAAHEQLNTYGRILDIPVRCAHDADELTRIFKQFVDKSLILIDTAGMSQRDMRLAEQFKLFRSTDQVIKTYLVMSAATQYGTMQEIVESFKVFDPKAGILTKFDETVTFGAAVSTMVEHRLPVSFITNGQKVPEHLHAPKREAIVKHCFTRQLGNQQSRQPAGGVSETEMLRAYA